MARIFTYAAWADKYDGAVHNAPMRNVTLAMHEPPGHRRFGLPRQRPVARPCLPGSAGRRHGQSGDRRPLRALSPVGDRFLPAARAQRLQTRERSRLVLAQQAAASGHETTDTDPGIATSQDDYSLEYYILNENHYQIELLTNLDKVPEAGAIAIATWPKPKKGSGFPARVFAIVP